MIVYGVIDYRDYYDHPVVALFTDKEDADFIKNECGEEFGVEEFSLFPKGDRSFTLADYYEVKDSAWKKYLKKNGS